jgi:large subunit ribosomal protein L10
MGEKTQKIQPRKVEAIQRIREMVAGSRDVLFTNFRGLTVEQITALRRALSKQQADFKVVKNNYARLALRELGMPAVDEFLVDPTAVALIRGDVGPVAKTLAEFGRETTLKIKGGLIDRRAASGDQVEAISRLPGREVLYAIVMGTMKAPVTNLALALSAVSSKLVRTLKAVADKKAAA